MPITTTSYHEQIKILNIFSLQRRRERCATIYIYKIIIQLVPNPGLEVHHKPRTKVKVTLEQNISRALLAWVRSLRNGRFFVIGPQVYNSIPATLRKLEKYDEGEEQKVENLKKKLGEYLGTLPDAPGTSQNSLLQQK